LGAYLKREGQRGGCHNLGFLMDFPFHSRSNENYLHAIRRLEQLFESENRKCIKRTTENNTVYIYKTLGCRVQNRFLSQSGRRPDRQEVLRKLDF